MDTSLLNDPNSLALVSYLVGWLFLPRPLWVKTLYDKFLALVGHKA